MRVLFSSGRYSASMSDPMCLVASLISLYTPAATAANIVTIQDLGWRNDGRYLDQKSDISSVVFWYQTEPHAKFPTLPSVDDLEIVRPF